MISGRASPNYRPTGDSPVVVVDCVLAESKLLLMVPGLDRVLTYFSSQLKASIEIPLTLASDFECAVKRCALKSETKLRHHLVDGSAGLNLGPEVGDVRLPILLL